MTGCVVNDIGRMVLSDITAISVLEAIEEFRALGREEFLSRHGFGEARSYHLLHDGRRYPSKAIVGVAHGIARPDLGPLRSTEFSGGETTVAASAQPRVQSSPSIR
jgi:hypothetical protein